MFEPIWQAVKQELSGERARDFTARIWEHARWNDFQHLARTAAEVAAIMREIGLQDVQILEFPADGVTAYGGWVLPEAWDVDDATLEIAESAIDQLLLAHYRKCPQSLIMYSAPTPPEGLVAEVVAVPGAARPGSYEGIDVEGKLVLADAVGIDVWRNAVAHGAIGIVADAMKLAGSPHEKSPAHFDHASQWHNYTLPPWKTDQKAFGFSISPANGRRLRDLLATHGTVSLKAVVRSRLYVGTLPVVTGLLPGESHEEIAISGHLCEPGANDNASGPALGLEAVRTIKALCEQGKLPALTRGIRPVFSFEVRGYQAFLANWPHLDRLVAGINLDMVGNDLSEARARANLMYNWPVLPACTDALALALLRRLQRDDPLFRFRAEEAGLVDNLFGEPAVGAPMCVLGNWPDATYHTSLDRIDSISPAAMAAFGRAAATYCAFLATAGFPQATWLADLTAAFAKEEILGAAPRLATDRRRCNHCVGKNIERLRSAARFVPAASLHPTAANADAHPEAFCSWSGLFPREELLAHTARLADDLQDFAARELDAARRQRTYADQITPAEPRPERPAPPEHEAGRARTLAPLRTFLGSPCFETLAGEAEQELRERTGLSIGWGAPHWLHLALFLANGKRSAWDIWQWLRDEGIGIGLDTLNNTLDLLTDHGFIRLRPVLSKDDYLAALRSVGVPQGATLMVHSSLSGFGYVQGGAETVIDALLEVLGPQGTTCMPTLSFSWLGRPPYDPATTPSRVGAITNAFRQRPAVLRSAHPTHSVAALGPKADEITSGHLPDRPVLGPQSPYARLYDLDAWVLMLCRVSANTTLHLAEERAGLLRLDFLAPTPDGRRITLPHMPWHANFGPHYDLLRRRGQLRTAPLGEGTITLMRVRHAVDAATENLQADPLLVTRPDCQCESCQTLRARLAP